MRWCLAKATKELEQGKQHRGLVERASNDRLAYQHLAKAEHNLKAVLYFKEGGFEDWSISAGFYCLYHCMLALLAKHGYESRNQECTLATIEYLVEQKRFVLDPEFINVLKQHERVETRHEKTVIALRELFQYGVDIDVPSTELQWLTTLCKNAIDAVKEIIPK